MLPRPRSPAGRRWLLRAAKLLLLGLLGWAMHATLRRALDELGQPRFSESLGRLQYGWLAVAAILYAGSLLPTAFFSYQLLRALGQPVGWGQAVRAFIVSQVGKYVPGKAMVVVLRASLLRGPGVESTVVVASVFVDTLTTMATGSLVALIALLGWGAQRRTTLLIAAGMLLVTGLPAIPVVFARLIRLLRIHRLNPAAVERLRALPRGVVVRGWLIVCVSWLLQGSSLWAVLRAMQATEAGPWTSLPLDTAAAALAVVAGFLTMIPGGLIGREFVLTELMAPEYGAASAALSAILLRLVWLVAELVLSSILYLAGRQPATAGHAAPDP